MQQSLGYRIYSGGCLFYFLVLAKQNRVFLGSVWLCRCVETFFFVWKGLFFWICFWLFLVDDLREVFWFFGFRVFLIQGGGWVSVELGVCTCMFVAVCVRIFGLCIFFWGQIFSFYYVFKGVLILKFKNSLLSKLCFFDLFLRFLLVGLGFRNFRDFSLVVRQDVILDLVFMIIFCLLKFFSGVKEFLYVRAGVW